MSAQESSAILGASLTKSIPGLAGINAKNLGALAGGAGTNRSDLFLLVGVIR
jgi:hypothetical protein